MLRAPLKESESAAGRSRGALTIKARGDLQTAVVVAEGATAHGGQETKETGEQETGAMRFLALVSRDMGCGGKWTAEAI